MQKWTLRRDAMTFVNDLEASVALHEFRLESIDSILDEYTRLLKTLRNEAKNFAAMLLFNEVLSHYYVHILYKLVFLIYLSVYHLMFI